MKGLFYKSSKRKKTRSGRRTLVVISMLLFGSAALRVGIGTTGAIALESAEVPAMADTEKSSEMAETSDEMHACTDSEGLVAVLQEVNERAKMLNKKEASLMDRMAALSLAEAEIKKNLMALQKAEEELSRTLALADEAAEGDLAQLTTVYENMKPKEAAELFEEMTPDFAAGFLARMRPEAAASIMAGLEPQTAYSISVVLAGRNANVPKE